MGGPRWRACYCRHSGVCRRGRGVVMVDKVGVEGEKARVGNFKELSLVMGVDDSCGVCFTLWLSCALARVFRALLGKKQL